MAMGEDVKTIRGLLEGYSDLSDLLDVAIPFLAPPNAQWPEFLVETRKNGCNFGRLVGETRSSFGNFNRSLYVYGQSVSVSPLLLCKCTYWEEKTVNMRTMNEMLKNLDSTTKEWKMVLFFCVKLAEPRERSWDRTDIGCVKINCRAQGSPSCQVEWVFQPDEGARMKLIVVLETGTLT